MTITPPDPLPETPEKQVVRAFVDCLNGRVGPAAARGGLDPFSYLAPDAVITINGTTPLSGRYEGAGMIARILVSTASAVIRSLEVTIDRLIGHGPSLAALLVIRARTQAGKALNTANETSGCTFEIKDGRISAIRLFPDTSLIELELYGWRYVPNRGVTPDSAQEIG